MSRRRSVRRSLGFCAALVLLARLTAACGDGSDAPSTTAAVLPLGEGDPRAVAESALAADRLTAVQPEHLCIMRLEAAGTHAGDTGTTEGVDRVRYHFAVATELTLAIDANASQLGRVILRDHSGRALLDVEPGREAAIVAEPGTHVLELHHARAADPTAPAQIIFLRPAVSAPPHLRTSATQIAPAVARIEAGQDCTGCDFSNSDLSGMTFDGLDLSDCIMSGAALSGTSFVCAALTRCQFQPPAGAPPPEQENTIFDGADLIAARFDGVRLFGATFRNATCLGRDTPARLDGSTWEPGVFGPALVGGVDFSGSSLAGAKFTGAVVTRSRFDGADLTMAIFTVQGSALRFPGATLVGTDLRGATFTEGTSFAGAILADVRMEGAALRGVSFMDAEMSGVLFAGAALADADFSGADFAGVDLSQADLSGAILSPDTSFAGAILSDGVARGVNLACDAAAGRGGCFLTGQPAQFAGADLTAADLTSANLEAMDLGGATLDGARLVGANLNLSNLRDASLRAVLAGAPPGSGAAAASLRGAYLVGVDLSDADLRSADLSNAHLYGDARRTLLVRTQLDSATLVQAICSGATFTESSLTDASVDGAQLVNAIFDGADLTNAKLDSAYLQGADFSTAASVTGISLSNAAVSTMPGAWTFTEQDGTPSTYQFGATELGAIAQQADVTCPNDAPGPCNSAASLIPVNTGPFPPVPPCTPSGLFCWENCLPTFDCQTQCGAWSCGATCASCSRGAAFQTNATIVLRPPPCPCPSTRATPCCASRRVTSSG